MSLLEILTCFPPPSYFLSLSFSSNSRTIIRHRLQSSAAALLKAPVRLKICGVLSATWSLWKVIFMHTKKIESVAKPYKCCHLKNVRHLRSRDMMDTKLENPALTKFGSCSDFFTCLPGVVVWMISFIQYFLFGLTPLFFII